MPNVSAVVSTTRGISCCPACCLRIPLTPTISSSGNPPISLCMPGVLAVGGPRGREEERAWRLRGGPVEGASLRGPSGALVGDNTSAGEDMVVTDVVIDGRLLGFETKIESFAMALHAMRRVECMQEQESVGVCRSRSSSSATHPSTSSTTTTTTTTTPQLCTLYGLK